MQIHLPTLPFLVRHGSAVFFTVLAACVLGGALLARRRATPGSRPRYAKCATLFVLPWVLGTLACSLVSRMLFDRDPVPSPAEAHTYAVLMTSFPTGRNEKLEHVAYRLRRNPERTEREDKERIAASAAYQREVDGSCEETLRHLSDPWVRLGLATECGDVLSAHHAIDALVELGEFSEASDRAAQLTPYLANPRSQRDHASIHLLANRADLALRALEWDADKDKGRCRWAYAAALAGDEQARTVLETLALGAPAEGIEQCQRLWIGSLEGEARLAAISRLPERARRDETIRLLWIVAEPTRARSWYEKLNKVGCRADPRFDLPDDLLALRVAAAERLLGAEIAAQNLLANLSQQIARASMHLGAENEALYWLDVADSIADDQLETVEEDPSAVQAEYGELRATTAMLRAQLALWRGDPPPSLSPISDAVARALPCYGDLAAFIEFRRNQSVVELRKPKDNATFSARIPLPSDSPYEPTLHGTIEATVRGDVTTFMEAFRVDDSYRDGFLTAAWLASSMPEARPAIARTLQLRERERFAAERQALAFVAARRARGFAAVGMPEEARLETDIAARFHEPLFDPRLALLLTDL